MFERPEEDTPESPRRVVILSVEGNKTEQDYFNYVEKYREQLGIKACVHVHPLKRAKHDNHSAPEDVLELLEEYIELRNSKNLPKRMRDVIPEVYSDGFIKKYLDNSADIDSKRKKDFEWVLEQAGIDIQYDKYLKDISGKDDAFGIVIDRDYHSHSVKQLQSIVKQCEEKGYRCFITTPLVEFWLLLHVANIKEIYSDELEKFRENEVASNKHTYTSKKLSELAGHTKSISENKFKENYLNNIDYAIEQVKTNFTTDINELIGTDENDDTKKGALGSNLPELFELLRKE